MIGPPKIVVNKMETKKWPVPGDGPVELDEGLDQGLVHLALAVELVLPDVVWEVFGGVHGNLVAPVTVVNGEKRRVGVEIQDGVVSVL